MNMKPTAWLKELPPKDGNGMMMTTFEEVAKEWEEPVTPLYAKRDWVGLTADELNMIFDSMRTWSSWTITDVYFAIEAKLKEKNNG